MDTKGTYRVLRLATENFKRIQVADVTPGRHAVLVAGKNKAGKTSLLDSIVAVLGGKRNMPAQPLRQGAEDGQIVCILGEDKPELLVKRTFDQSGKTVLEITSAEGYKAPTPQAILDSLCSSIAFDPIEFLRMKPKDQLETLRELVGVDFSELDKAYQDVYDIRTEANRSLKHERRQLESIIYDEGTPDEPVSIKELLAERHSRDEHNRLNDHERNKLEKCKGDLAHAEATVADLERRLEEALDHKNQAKLLLEAQQKTVDVLEDKDVADITDKIERSEDINEQVRFKKAHHKTKQSIAELEDKIGQLTQQLDGIVGEKRELIDSAEWPVLGLELGEDGVLYNDLPFEQASGAEQLEVSFAMAAASNPQLKVAIIRDASLLDEEQMAVVVQLAEQYDTQVWLEVVSSEAGECGILIEEGMVKEGATPQEEPKVTKKRKKKADLPELHPDVQPPAVTEEQQKFIADEEDDDLPF